MVTIQKITEENFAQCLNLSVTVEKDSFVDPPVYSLAEAWLYGKDALPFAIYRGAALVGFVSLYVGEGNCQIINFLIADPYQRKGIGTQAARICIQYLQNNFQATRVSVPVFQENTQAVRFWKKLGFTASESVEDGYMFMRLPCI